MKVYIIFSPIQDPEFFNPTYWSEEGREIVRKGQKLLEKASLDTCMRKEMDCVFREPNNIVYDFIKRN